MEYFRILNLAREPFSSSPEPDFFYESFQHLECLQQLELALRLRRGLSVVIGQVGAGKTTLSRQLIRKFAGDPEVNTHLMLDPHFSTEIEFLHSVAGLFGIHDMTEHDSPWQIRERIKNHLFHQAVEKNKLVVLIIDEGQKIPDFAMESLREFLNYETNEHKLLQIAVFAQEEFRKNLVRHPGFADRINFNYNLGPLSLNDTCAMVLFRIERAAEEGKGREAVTFTKPALRAIYRETGGYPRKIVRMCHQVLLAMIIKNKSRVDWRLVRDVARRSRHENRQPLLVGLRVPLTIGILLVIGGGALYYSLVGHTGLTPAGLFSVGDKTAAKAGIDAETGREFAFTGSREETIRNPGADYPERLASGDYPSELLPDRQLLSALDDTEKVLMSGRDVRKTEDPPAEKHSMPPHDEMPAVLGSIDVMRNQFVCRMIRSIYGVCDDELKSSFREVNPAIQDLNRVFVGQRVTMPALVDSRDDFYRQGFWIRIDEGDSLNQAYKKLRSINLPESRTRILPYWTDDQGLRFAIVLRQDFRDEDTARGEQIVLSERLGAGSDVVTKWPENAVFYGKQ